MSRFSAIDRISNAVKPEAIAPRCSSFRAFLDTEARVPLRGGAYGPFSFVGRRPLDHIVTLIDAILRNVINREGVVIHGRTFKPGTLKNAQLDIGGGAQWGKTVLTLNLMAYLTAIGFLNAGYYVPDQELLAKIVDTKFRPDVVDQLPWLARMIDVGKAENESGKAVHRKTSYQVSDAAHKAFGHFCAMHRPPTTISLDFAALDEVDDIPDKNLGYVSGRMTGSPVALMLAIGTQRVHGAGQHKRVNGGTLDRLVVTCPHCASPWNFEEQFPRIIRIAMDGTPALTDPSIAPEMSHDRNALYYLACPSCGHPLDRDSGEYVPANPDRIAQAHFSVRVSQLAVSAISLQEIVGAWYSALTDPSGEALKAFHCDRIAIPNAGAAQPVTQTVIDRARSLGAPMSLTSGTAPRFAGVDTGPRCWLWVDECPDGQTSAQVWSELIASGNLPARLPLLMEQLGIRTVFIDAGGEPDLTRRLCLALNGLENYRPPVMPQTELIRSHLAGIGADLTWDGPTGRWHNIRCAAVLFSSREARGVEQTLGFTADGLIYPLIKCHRAESIQTAVNDFLTPTEGVIELVDAGESSAQPSPISPRPSKVVRTAPRARLATTVIGPGVNLAMLDGHLLNLRKERDTVSGREDWIDGVENHLGLAKVYARLAAAIGNIGYVPSSGTFSPEAITAARMGGNGVRGLLHRLRPYKSIRS